MTDVQTTELAAPAVECRHSAAPAGGTRRAVLTGAGALGVGCLLAACGNDSTGTGGNNPNGSGFTTDPAPAGSAAAPATTTTEDGAGNGATALATVSEVPEGGGVIKGDLVITQPEKGTFKAFSKVCTHAGCDVSKVDAGVIFCPCHKSTFSITDGSPQGGPADKPLPETQVKVDGDNIVAA